VSDGSSILQDYCSVIDRFVQVDGSLMKLC